jgi:uncharacterized protein (UPF0548 family)
MFSLHMPSTKAIRRFLASEAALSFTYAAVGATATTPPVGFIVDHTRVKLGQGEAVFNAAKAALQRWDQFRLGWVEPAAPEAAIRVGEVVGVLGRTMGVWSLNSCRIIYVLDESEPVSKFGFAYGTLPGHVARGEERFLIEWDRRDNDVWYDILAFSRPNHFLTRVGYYFVRRLQKQFGRDSVASMRRSVAAMKPV